MMLKLFGHDTSPYVRRVRVLLAELALPFARDSNSWSVADAEVLRLNPMLRVPALADKASDGTVQHLLDSKLIAEYLYERYPPSAERPPAAMALPLAPTLFAPSSRWDDQNALLIVEAALDSAINVFLLDLDGISPSQSSYLGRQQERIRRCLRWLEERLGDATTFHPGHFSFLDIGLMCALQWLEFRNRYPIADHPSLVRFVAAHRDRPTLSATHPSRALSTLLPNVQPPVR